MKKISFLIIKYLDQFFNKKPIYNIGLKYSIAAPKVYFVVITLAIHLTSCTKLVEVEIPDTSINGDNVFTTDATAAAMLTGIYTKMSQQNFISSVNTSLFLGLSADELILNSGVSNVAYNAYYSNSLSSINTIQGASDFWNMIYPTIFAANLAIEGLQVSIKLTPFVKNQLLGEAKFIRAFCYFYLVNLYGDVPLVISTDFKVNSTIPRSASEAVYKQIVSDLKDAESVMSQSFVDATILNTTLERTRPNKWTATALLARVYLYTGDYANAELKASDVINNSNMFKLDLLNDVFTKNSNEAIWQLQPTGSGTSSNTPEGKVFILTASGPTSSITRPVYLSDNLLNNFEQNDLRRNNWVNKVTVGSTNYYYAYKYKIGSVDVINSEYIMVLRLGELYLIRAESRINQNRIPDGIEDLNVLRSRATDPTLPTYNQLPMLSVNISQSEALQAVIHERQIELFSEWGNRWLDLKRTKKIDEVMRVVTLQKGGIWNTNKRLFPIPQVEIDRNTSLKGHQNSGYN